MHKIDTDTAVDGEFTDGDGTVENPATDLNAAWFNSVQRELLAVLSGVGISPDENDDSQIWKALQKVGIRCVYSDTDVDVSGFSGATIIFHDASDFELNGLLSTKSFVVIVPFWSDNSPATISVTYNNQVLDINRHQAFVGYAANGFDELELAGVFIPVFSSEGLGGTLTIGGLNVGNVVAESIRSTKLYGSIDTFHYSTDTVEGVNEWRAWQLASKWGLGQIKRVWCDNAIDTGTNVSVTVDASGTQRLFSFYPYAYIEFTCIGTYEYEDIEYAVLLANGKN